MRRRRRVRRQPRGRGRHDARGREARPQWLPGAARPERAECDRAGRRARRAGSGASGHPRQQRGLEHRHPVHRPRRAHHGDLGPHLRHERARAVSACARGRAAHAPAGRRAHRQHRVGGGGEADGQLDRVRVEQGRPDPPHALPRGRAGAGHHRQRRGPGPRRRYADGGASRRTSGITCVATPCFSAWRITTTSRARWSRFAGRRRSRARRS